MYPVLEQVGLAVCLWCLHFCMRVVVKMDGRELNIQMCRWSKTLREANVERMRTKRKCTESWRGSLVAKSTWWFSRGPRFDSRCPSSSSQVSVTFLLGDTVVSYILFRHQAQKWHTDIWGGWKLKHIKQFLKILTNVLLSMTSSFHSGCRHFIWE